MRSTDLGRLARYGLSGAASAATHFGVGLALAEGLRIAPVAASTIGFAASVVVSYAGQHTWVFRSPSGHAVAAPRFLAVTAAAAALNAVVLWLGTAVLHGPYPLIQALAIVLIPVLNYTLNSRWTFA
ncbi:MAG: hypothetical protein QOE51_3004 [Actinoplanes sp.]|nr:hypothetical protein [Actinoplanes sp.]